MVEHSLNNRAITQSSIIPVRGFSDHEVWRFDVSAGCVFLHSAARWSARISLAGMVSPLLRVEEVHCRFSQGGTLVAGSWRGRRLEPSGVLGSTPDLVFAAGTLTQPVADPPPLRGDWLFFLENAGCSGAPPQVYVELKILCGP